MESHPTALILGVAVRTIEDIKERVLEGVMRYNKSAVAGKRVVRVDLFGSYAAGTASDESDIDLLVEFATPHVGLFALAAILEAMEEAIGASVDVVQIPLPADSLLEIERSVSLYAAA